jgi:PilZ domain
MPNAIAERRSQRIPLDVPLVIKGRTRDLRDFREETFTLSASAHGVLLAMKTKVALGQRVQLFNRRNWDELEGQVVYIGLPHAGLIRVGIEFEQPAPDFWSLAVPPADWSTTET